MVDDGVADGAAAAGDHLQVLRRQPALVDEHLRQREAAEGRLAGGLQHHRATGSDGGADLVHHQVEREVERRDGTDHTDGDAQGEAHLALPRRNGIEGDHLAAQLARLGGSELERAGSTLGLDARGLDGLGRLFGDDLGELLAPGGEASGRPIEDVGPLPQRQRVGVERSLGDGDGAVDVGGGLRRDLADDGIVVGRADGDHIGHASDDTGLDELP